MLTFLFPYPLQR